MIISVTQGDGAAGYNSVITNNCDSVTSSNAAVTGTPGVTITMNPNNASVCQGQDAGFRVSTAGAGTPRYRWRLKSTLINA